MKGAAGIVSAAAAGTDYEAPIIAGTNLQYWRGDKTWQTLNTANVPEVTNLYYTNVRAQAAITGTLPISVSSGVVSLGFNSTNLKQTLTNQLTTIQDIATTSSPAFAMITLSGEVLTVGSNASRSVVFGSMTSTGSALRNAVFGKAGNNAMTGSRNGLFGIDCGTAITSGSNNVLIGDQTGTAIATGGTNTMVGSAAGQTCGVASSGNVFIGYQAGYNESGNNKLYISNSSTATPLISGDFTNQYVNIFNKLNVNSTQTTQSLYVNGNSQIMGRFGVNAIGPGACCNITGETTNGNENQTLYVSGTPLRNATYFANYNSIATYFDASNSATGAYYNYYGLNIGANAGPSANIANSFGAYFTNPNMSTTGSNLALYADDITVGGAITGKITNGIYCGGSAQIRTQQSIGGTAPQANTRLYVDAGGIATESFAIQSNAYPVRTTGMSSYANITAYGNWTEVKGGTMNYIGIDAGSTSGSNPFIGSAFGIYCRNPAASTLPANNIALFADDISVGATGNKIPNGVYCSSDLKCGGDFYNGSFSTSTKFYSEVTVSTTWMLDLTHTTTANIKYIRAGNMVTVMISNFAMTSNGGLGYPQCAIAPGYVPLRNQSIPIQISNNGTGTAPGMLYMGVLSSNFYIYSSTQTQAFTGSGQTFWICPTSGYADIVFTYSLIA